MKPLVIYHANCADGFTAAWCFHRANALGYDFHPGVYGQEPPDCTDREVFLVDFSYKREVVERMLKTARSVCLIDHHKTAIEDLRPLFMSDSWTGEPKQLAWFTDTERSGAGLAWDYLFPGEPRPFLLGYVQDRDLWRFKLPSSQEVNSFIFSHAYSFETWDWLMSLTEDDLPKVAMGGASIARKHHKDVAELVAALKRRMRIAGHDVPVAGLPYTYVSDAAHLMAKGEAFAACYWDTPGGRVFGLRSTEDGVDVSAVATTYGGGGHKHAAGFTVPWGHELTMP